MIHDSLGNYLRKLREERRLPLRKIAAFLDIDPSTLSKIERGERYATKEMLPILADIFGQDEEILKVILLSDKVTYELISEQNSSEILHVAEEKIRYMRSNRSKQGILSNCNDIT